MIEDQAQYGVGFHLHGFFDKGQPFAGRVLPVFRFRGLKNALDLAEKRLEQAAEQRVLRLIADLDRPDGRAGTFGDLPQRRAPIALFPETRRARLRRFSRPARDFDGPWIRLLRRKYAVIKYSVIICCLRAPLNKKTAAGDALRGADVL